MFKHYLNYQFFICISDMLGGTIKNVTVFNKNKLQMNFRNQQA